MLQLVVSPCPSLGDLESQKMYEDEYDDTYDSNAIGAVDADSADELTNNT